MVLKRNEAYIGVLIDDLTTHGITEPYRMFTSRAEYRLMLSQNNAEQRLLIKAFNAGLVDSERKNSFTTKEVEYKEFLEAIKKIKTTKITDRKNKTLELKESKNVFELLKRTDIDTTKVFKPKKKDRNLYKRAVTESKYMGYVEKQKREIKKTQKQNNKKIPQDFKYNNIPGLSNEVKEKLIKQKPETIGQASKIEGVTPAAVNLILIQIKKKEILKQHA